MLRRPLAPMAATNPGVTRRRDPDQEQLGAGSHVIAFARGPRRDARRHRKTTSPMGDQTGLSEIPKSHGTGTIPAYRSRCQSLFRGPITYSLCQTVVEACKRSSLLFRTFSGCLE